MANQDTARNASYRYADAYMRAPNHIAAVNIAKEAGSRKDWYITVGVTEKNPGLPSNFEGVRVCYLPIEKVRSFE